MARNVDKHDQTDDRPAYDPPRALSLGHMGTGTGGLLPCNLPGSSAEGNCETGLLAVSACAANGNSASACAGDGNSATGLCGLDGSGF